MTPDEAIDRYAHIAEHIATELHGKGYPPPSVIVIVVHKSSRLHHIVKSEIDASYRQHHHIILDDESIMLAVDGAHGPTREHAFAPDVIRELQGFPKNATPIVVFYDDKAETSYAYPADEH